MSIGKENIFAHGVALDQAGRFKNAIHCFGNVVYIMNTDATAILRFTLPEREQGFKTPISFFANDYDSAYFTMRDGKVVFTQQGEEFTRNKSCAVPKQTFAEVEELFNSFWSKEEVVGSNASISINKKTLSLLDSDLSHIEIYADKGAPVILQRDIFSGNTIELKRKSAGFGLGAAKDTIPFDFGPIGIRTSDFNALFTFNDNLNFFFYKDNNNYCLVTGDAYGFCGILGGCIYDELNTLEVVTHGRKEQKDGRGVAGTDQKDTGKKRVPVGKK